jgi:hypothetical protein
MLILNTTFLVSDEVQNQWLNWVREQHIPFMLNTKYFKKPQIAKVLGNDTADGTSYSVQFQVNDSETLEKWHSEFAGKYEQSCYQVFGNEALFFSTILEILD